MRKTEKEIFQEMGLDLYSIPICFIGKNSASGINKLRGQSLTVSAGEENSLWTQDIDLPVPMERALEILLFCLWDLGNSHYPQHNSYPYVQWAGWNESFPEGRWFWKWVASGQALVPCPWHTWQMGLCALVCVVWFGLKLLPVCNGLDFHSQT